MRQISKEEMAEQFRLMQEIFERYQVSQEEQDALWNIFAMFCVYQIQHRQGIFYDKVKETIDAWVEDTSKILTGEARQN